MSSNGSRYTKDLLQKPGMTFAVEVADPKERIQAYLDAYRNRGNPDTFDHAIMVEHLSLVAATVTPPATATATFELLIVPSLGSSMGNMHGGAVSLVYDMCTTMCAAPLSRREFWLFGGVSRQLNITFLRPVKVGTTVVVECEVLSVGKRFATMRAVMKDKSSGKELSVAEHTKVTVDFHAL